MKKIHHHTHSSNSVVFRLTGYLPGEEEEVRKTLAGVGVSLGGSVVKTGGYCEIKATVKGTATIAQAIQAIGSTLLPAGTE